jgi:hypothetical protein
MPGCSDGRRSKNARRHGWTVRHHLNLLGDFGGQLLLVIRNVRRRGWRYKFYDPLISTISHPAKAIDQRPLASFGIG